MSSNKRTSNFQGRPENPYDDRDDPIDPVKKATAAQMATRKIKSAKSSRRPANAVSGLSMTPINFAFNAGNASTSNANPPVFGSQQQQDQPAQNGAAFSGVFGGGATNNSFPPAQPATTNNNFSSSSFPAFGGSNSNTTFNPQPPSAGFSFAVGATNPFATSAPAPTTNGSANPGGMGGSVFGSASSQPQQGNSILAGFGQNNTSSPAPFGGFGSSNATSTAPIANVHGTSGAISTALTPKPSLLGTSSASSATSFASPAFGTTSAPTSSLFGSSFASSSPKNAMATGPAQSGFNFSSPQPAPAFANEPTPKPTNNNFFGNAPVSTAPSTWNAATPTSNSFTPFGTTTQGGNTSTAAAGNGLFQTAATTQGASSSMSAPVTNMLGAKTQSDANSTPGAGLFQNLGASSQGDATKTQTANSNFFGGFGATAQGNSASAPAVSNSLFKGFGATAQGDSPSTPGSNTNLFNSFGATSQGDPASTPAVSNGLLQGFGATTQAESKSTPAPVFGSIDRPTGTPTATPLNKKSSKPASKKLGPLSEMLAAKTQANALSKTATAPSNSIFSSTPATNSGNNTSSTSLFSPSTPQTAFKPLESTSQEPESTTLKRNNMATSFSTRGPGTGIFAEPFPPESPNTLNLSNKKPTLFARPEPVGSKRDDAQKTPSQQNAQNAPNFFNRASSPTKQQAPLSPASSMPTLTGAAAPPPAASSSTADAPNIPRAHAAANWASANTMDTDLQGLTVQLVSLNEQYRSKLASLPATADWTPLSQWHSKASTEIMQKITAAKKQLATAKGITGHESSLSVKRKASDDNDAADRIYDASPSKKPRGVAAPTTPTPKMPSLFSTTPKQTPPPSETSNLFGSVLNSKSTGATTSEKKDNEPVKSSTPQSGFSFGKSATTGPSKPASQMPATSSSSKNSIFGGTGLLSQFKSKAKTYEELVAERKAKDKEADYDSDEEDEEEWSKRWDEAEAKRQAEMKEKENATPTVEVSGPPTASNGGLNLLPGAIRPVGGISGSSSPGLLGSRVASPALSTRGQSVFDTPELAQSPSNNIFGHLSAAPSSNQDDEDSEEGHDNEEASESYESGAHSTAEQRPYDLAQQPRKRKVFDTESESEESPEETTRHKKQDIKKPSLADRMTRDAPDAKTDDSEKENGDPNKFFSPGQTNGVQTPTNKPYKFFDFDGAAQSAPPKQGTFGGDQTYKAGDVVKFGTVTKGNPSFQFQPATPGPSDFSATPSKPPASTFSFLNAASSANPASGFSSRAPTPLSEAETSGKESAADNDDEQGGRQEQLDLSHLTDDEKADNEILFQAEPALCKHQITKPGGEKEWAVYARGSLYILKNKETGKAILRMRLKSGSTVLNYYLLPKLTTAVTGGSKRMVSAMGTKSDGKTGNLVFAVKTTEIATNFSNIYNENLPA